MARLEGADISIQDFVEENRGLSQSNLQHAFDKTNILLTGVTSFIGSVILEKLLRSCPDVNCVYVLIRGKEGKKPVERMKVLFRSPLFDRLKMEHSNSLNKVHVIPCDLFKKDLGISNDDYLMLSSTVNAVIHVARLIGSTVILKDAVIINLKALIGILHLCHEMKKLDAFAYVSSIYAHFNNTTVEEKLHPCLLSGDCLMNLIDNFSEETLKAITPGITGEYPNISLLTLAVAESVLNVKGEGLPVCIIRPPFLLPSCNEPIAGWIQRQRLENPTDILLNLFQGKIYTLYCDDRTPTEGVPVDKVSNLILASVGNLLLKRKEWINQAVIISNNLRRSTLTQTDFQDIQVYNIVLSNKQKLKWSDYFRKSIQHVEEVPFLDTIWYASLCLNKSWLLKWIVTWLQNGQIILYDKMRRVFGFNSESLETIKRHQNTSNTVLRFCKHWDLKDDNVDILWETISEADRIHFDFNLKSFDWNQFFYTQCRGIRVYLVHDPLSTVPDAQKNRKKMKKAYYLFLSFIAIVICFILYKMFLF